MSDSRVFSWAVIKSGTSDLNAVPYINPWSSQYAGYPAFEDFFRAKNILESLIIDILDVLKEQYEDRLQAFNKNFPQFAHDGLAFYYSEEGNYLAEKVMRFVHYRQVVQEAQNFEELDFKYLILWSSLNKNLSIHYQILGKMKCPSLEDENRLDDVYLIRTASGIHHAVLRSLNGPVVLKRQEIEERFSQIGLIGREINTLLNLCR